MIDVVIVNPQKVIYEGEANSVLLPGEQGVFEVLPYHKDLLSRLITGEVLVDGRPLRIHRGVVKVESNTVTAIVEEVQ